VSLRRLHDTLWTTKPTRRATAHHFEFTRRRRYRRYGVDRNHGTVGKPLPAAADGGRNVELHLPIRREQTPFQHSQNLDMGIVDKTCQCQAQQGRIQHCNTSQHPVTLASQSGQGLGNQRSRPRCQQIGFPTHDATYSAVRSPHGTWTPICGPTDCHVGGNREHG
jgi:hypothetical protein